jgi:hypothetical protein
LNAERIEIKFVSLAPIVESVEEDADVIVVEDIVALGDVRAHLVRFIETMKGYVDKLRVTSEKYFGGF